MVTQLAHNEEILGSIPCVPIMPLEQVQCPSGCGCTITQCPACGEPLVTPRDNPSHPSPNDVIDYGKGDSDTIEYRHVCWDCDWSETVTMEVTRA